MRRRTILLSVTSLLVVVASLGVKAQTLAEKRSLRGLKGVRVIVEKMDKDVEENGLTQSQLRTDAELKLRKAGIYVAMADDGLSNPNIGTLHIDVTAKQIKSAKGLYLGSVTVELLQDVRLLRDSSITVFDVTTYESSSDRCLTVGADHLRDDVRNDVNDRIDAFINDYLAMNPKT